MCFLFLISLNGLYLLISAKTRFSEDIDTFQEIAKTGLINDFSFFSRDNPLLAAETKSLIERLSEDIIIIRKDGKVEKNGFFENVAIEYELFKSTET